MLIRRTSASGSETFARVSPDSSLGGSHTFNPIGGTKIPNLHPLQLRQIKSPDHHMDYERLPAKDVATPSALGGVIDFTITNENEPSSRCEVSHD